MSHFNRFNLIADFDLEASRTFLGQIITNPAAATLEGSAECIEIRHLSAHLDGMEDYGDVERQLSVRRLHVEPFQVVLKGVELSALRGTFRDPRICSHTDSIDLSVSAKVSLLGLDVSQAAALKPLQEVAQGEVRHTHFISQTRVTGASIKLAEPFLLQGSTPVLDKTSNWTEKRLPSKVPRGYKPNWPYSQCDDCPPRYKF